MRIFWVFVMSLFILPIFAATAELTHQYQLQNGLTLVVREDHRAPVIVTSVWYKVGGSYEQNGITGVSHALEHLMFRGTKKYGPGVFNRIISDNGGEQNAMTSADYTMYYQKLASNKLPLAFELEADRMRNLVITPEIFAREINVVKEERRMRVDDNPMGLLWERFQAAAHVNNPYHHPTVGWMTDLENMTYEDAKNWYHTWYAPNNAVVIVVGDVKPEQVFDLAKQYFGSLQAEKIPKLKPRTEIKSLSTRSVDVYLPAKLPILFLGYNTPILQTVKESWKVYALNVLAYLLSGGDSSRFSKNLVRGSQIAVSADVSFDPFTLHEDLFVISAVPSGQTTIPQLKQAILQEITKVQTDLVSSQELDRVKAQLISAKIYSKDSLSSQASLIGVPMMAGLTWQEGDRYVENLNAVTAEQVQQVAKEYLTASRLTIGVLHPKAEELRAKS